MKTTRIEAFSDGVIAIIITIMVLEMKVPHESDIQSLAPLIPVFLSYILSFVYVGIYWNNHHHMFQLTEVVNGAILWANLHLLFWLSLLPFVTGWMGESPFALLPTVLYGVVLLMAAVAYFILQHCVCASQGAQSRLRSAVGRDLKGKLSPALYALGILFAFVDSRVSALFYLMPAVIWLVPDRRIERHIVEVKTKTHD